jgi:hypothetical protein
MTTSTTSTSTSVFCTPLLENWALVASSFYFTIELGSLSFGVGAVGNTANISARLLSTQASSAGTGTEYEIGTSKGVKKDG